MKRIASTAAITVCTILLSVLLYAVASAQDGCVIKVTPNGIVLDQCIVIQEPEPEPTAAATATPEPTATATSTSTATALPTQTPTPTATPITAAVLDNFNRTTLGSGWSGPAEYTIISNTLSGGNATQPLIFAGSFAGDQYASMTFASIAPTARELGFAFHVNADASTMVQVAYAPYSKSLILWTKTNGSWRNIASVPATYATGDVFAASVTATGAVLVYKNGVQIWAYQITDWAASNPGIGIFSYQGAGSRFDDFYAKGTQPTQPPPSATPTQPPPPTLTATPAPTLPPAQTPPPPPPTGTPGVTATAPPPAATGSYTVNVALYPNAGPGSPTNNYNNSSVIGHGQVSPNGGYVQSRFMGRGDGLMAYVQAFNPTLGGVIRQNINGVPQVIEYGKTPGWEYGQRCGATPDSCRGWTARRIIPWSELGGMPTEGAIWPLRQEAFGSTWEGVLRWGLPDYAGQQIAGTRVVTLPLSADAPVGGNTDCGSDDWPAYFPSWGSRNTDAPSVSDPLRPLGRITQASSGQNQTDIADWPCYARYYAMFDLPTLPAGAQIVSATVQLRHFGNSGYTAAYTPDGPQDTVLQVYEIADPWTEDGITWDNAPQPRENINRLTIVPIDVSCPQGGRCSVPYSLDVTEIARRAQAAGRPWVSLMTYTASGDYHSGKYIWTREGGDQAPVVRVAYVLPGEPTPTETPTWTPTSTPQPTATATASPTATPLPPAPTATATATAQPTLPPASGNTSCTYFVSLQGNDAAAGTAQSAAWRTFARAWRSLLPGETLCIDDGVYTEPLHPGGRNGEPGKPITVKALNDGKVVIDGQFERVPVKLGEVFGPNGEVSQWYVLEGLVARNGTEAVLRIRGSNNVVRRFSGYNANTDGNNQVILIAWAKNNLIEDCVASGTGRYMIDIFSSENITVRRCFTMWEAWEGRNFCGVAWPNGNNVGVYNSSNTTVENVVAYGRALTGIFIQANDVKAKAVNNQVLGSMAVLQGRDRNGEPWTYGTGQQQPTTRPAPSACPTNVRDWGWGGSRNGIELYGQGLVKDNVFRDVVAADNMGIGVNIERAYTPGYMDWSNNVFERITAWDNGAYLREWETQPRNPLGPNATNNSEGGAVISNSRIAGLTGPAYQGEGARMGFRYVDRQLTSQPLLPWPMEGRVQSELGVSVNAIWNKYAEGARAQ